MSNLNANVYAYSVHMQKNSDKKDTDNINEYSKDKDADKYAKHATIADAQYRSDMNADAYAKNASTTETSSNSYTESFTRRSRDHKISIERERANKTANA